MKQKQPIYRTENNTTVEQQDSPINSIFRVNSANIFLPLRLFLGISFLAAGLDKLLDPQFFDATSAGYIGNQLGGFAGQSPLGFFLKGFSAPPLASIIGGIVLVGELAIGLGTLLGFFSRVAAFCGFVLSVILWLTASWEITPFFLGSDLPYAIAWLTLFLAGPHPVLSLDAYLKDGGNEAGVGSAMVQPNYANRNPRNFPVRSGAGNVVNNTRFNSEPRPGVIATEEKAQVARRQFLVIAGGIILAGGFTGVAWLKTLHDELESGAKGTADLALPTTSTATQASTTEPATAGTPGNVANPTTATSSSPTGVPSTSQAAVSSTAASNSTAVTPAPATPTALPAATQAPAVNGKVIAKISDVAVGSALAFKTPNTGESAYLVHENDGSVKAFSSVCTHEGCDVSFIKSSQVFACPCHGAQFDAKTGAVLRRPARQPLPSFKVQVDANGNVIFIT